MEMTARDIHFRVRDEGTIVLLEPGSPAADTWLDLNIDMREATWWSGALVVEHRYARELLRAIRDAGFNVGAL